MAKKSKGSDEPVRVRERDRDPFRVEGKDPSRHYRWVRNKPERVEELKDEGFVVVRRGAEAAAPDAQGSDPGSLIKHGDTILMSQPMSQHERREREKAEDRKERLGAGMRMLHGDIDKIRRETDGKVSIPDSDGDVTIERGEE